MARPMVLMQESLLTNIWSKHVQGVPVLALIRHNNIDGKITAPTLTKLLSYLTAEHNTTDKKVAAIIKASMYPEWLVESNKQIVVCPSTHYYSGRMPLGKWYKRGEEPVKPAKLVKVKGKANVKR